MGLIKDFLFGRKVVVQDIKIGQLSTRVRGDNPSKNYTWTGEYQLTGQSKPTFFILEGNIAGPYRGQLKGVHRIVDTFNEIILEVDRELKGRHNIKARFKGHWTRDFYLAAIMPYDPELKQFEINFEPKLEDDTSYVGLLWKNDRLSEIVAK